MSDVRVSLPADTIFDALGLGVILLDRDCRIVVWNDWVARSTGLANALTIGKVIYEVWPALRDTRLQRVIEDSFQSGSSSILTYSLNKAILPLRGVGEEL